MGFYRCIVIVSFVAALFGTAKATPVVDQSVTPAMGMGLTGILNFCCVLSAQTYTAGITGSLTGVSVNVVPLEGASGPFPTLRVTIRTVEGGFPTDTILGESNVAAGISDFSSIISFPQPVPQTAGFQYAIALDYPGQPPGFAFSAWLGVPFDVYPRGRALALDPNGVWLTYNDGFDQHFRTLVEPVPEPSPLLTISAGLLALLLLARSLNRGVRDSAGTPTELHYRARAKEPPENGE